MALSGFIYRANKIELQYNTKETAFSLGSVIVIVSLVLPSCDCYEEQIRVYSVKLLQPGSTNRMLGLFNNQTELSRIVLNKNKPLYWKTKERFLVYDFVVISIPLALHFILCANSSLQVSRAHILRTQAVKLCLLQL